MYAKTLLISLIFLFSSLCFANEIYYEAKKGDKQAVQKIIKKYKNDKKKLAELLNFQDKYGTSALEYAAAKKDLELAKILVEAGAEVNIQDINGQTPLMTAIRRGSPELAEYFVGQGADVNTKTKYDYTPAQFAAGKKHLKIIKMLKKNGAELNAKDSLFGYTLVHEAIFNKNPKMVKYLAGQGVDVDIPATAFVGSTPLNIASGLGYLEIVNILLDNGAEPNKTDRDGNTSLHRAARKNNNLEVLKALVDGRADPNKKNNKGETAYDIAERNGNQKMIKFLKSKTSASKCASAVAGR